MESIFNQLDIELRMRRCENLMIDNNPEFGCSQPCLPVSSAQNTEMMPLSIDVTLEYDMTALVYNGEPNEPALLFSKDEMFSDDSQKYLDDEYLDLVLDDYFTIDALPDVEEDVLQELEELIETINLDQVGLRVSPVDGYKDNVERGREISTPLSQT